jgi:hypothetical protein
MMDETGRVGQFQSALRILLDKSLIHIYMWTKRKNNMLRNITFNLPCGLVRHAKVYAAFKGTSMTAIVRECLEQVTGWTAGPRGQDPLSEFSEGKMSKGRAIELLGLRDYSELLCELGKRNLPLPKMEDRHIRAMSETMRIAMEGGSEQV